MKKKILILLEEDSVKGGIQSSVNRHIQLMAPHFEIALVSFENTYKESDWYGKMELLKGKDFTHFHIQASDFASDTKISAKTGIENTRSDLRFRSLADKLIEVVESEKPDLMHVFGMFHQRGMIAAYASAKTSVPYLISFRGVDLETRVFDKQLASLDIPLRSAKAIVCVSEDSKRTVKALFAPNCPVHVAPNHFAPWQFEDQPVSIPLLEGRKHPLLGCFGSFRRVMGLDFLLESFSMLNEKSPHFLLLAGTIQKREVEFYNKLLEKNPYSKNIIRLGQVAHKNMLNYIRLVDVAVFPSISDASPNKVLEALAAGVPVVSTRTGGITELVQNEKHAILVKPKSAKEIAQAVEKILSDKPYRDALVANGKKLILEELNPENEAQNWGRIYQSIFAS